MFTAKCRNKPRVSTVGDALLDLPLNVHMCQTPFNGHSADNGGFTETVVSSMAHEVRTAALPSIDSTAGSSCSRVRPLVRQFCGFWLPLEPNACNRSRLSWRRTSKPATSVVRWKCHRRSYGSHCVRCCSDSLLKVFTCNSNFRLYRVYQSPCRGCSCVC